MYMLYVCWRKIAGLGIYVRSMYVGEGKYICMPVEFVIRRRVEFLVKLEHSRDGWLAG